MKRNSPVYKVLCLLIAILGIAFAAWRMNRPSAPSTPILSTPGPSPGVVGPVHPPAPGPMRVPTAMVRPPQPKTTPPVQRPTDTRPPRAISGTDAQADYGTLVYKDANGSVINGVTASYIAEPPPTWDLQRTRNQPPNTVGLSFLYNPPTPWVVFSHEHFEVVASARNMKLLKEGDNQLILPVVLGEDFQKIGINGQIVDENGKGVPKALIWMKSPTESREIPAPAMWVRSDDNGYFNIALRELENERPNSFILGIAPSPAVGLFPYYFETNNDQPITVKLKKPIPRRISLVDENGKPFKPADPLQRITIERRTLKDQPLSYLYYPGDGEYALDEGIYIVTCGYYKSQPVEITTPQADPIVFKITPPEGGFDPSGKPLFPMTVYATCLDNRGRFLAGAAVYLKKGDGPWVFEGIISERGVADFTLKSFGEYRICASFEGGPDKNPSLPSAPVTYAATDKHRHRIVTFPFSAEIPLGRKFLSATSSIRFTDALGGTMPQNTQVIFQPPDGLPVTHTLSDKSTLEGWQISKVYHPGFRIYHPDYGTAVVNAVPHTQPPSFQVPLVPNTRAKAERVFIGRCVGPDGKGVPNVRISARLIPPASPPEEEFQPKDGRLVAPLRDPPEERGISPTFALTDAEGNFRYRPYVFSMDSMFAMRQIPPDAPMELVAVPENTAFMPAQLSAIAGKPVQFQLPHSDREITLSFTDNDEKPASPLDFETTRTTVTGGDLFITPRGWLPESGKVRLAYGTYTFKDLKKGYEAKLEFKPDSPAKVALVPASPVSVVGTVVTMEDAEPVAGALVLVTKTHGTHIDAGALTAQDWKKIAALKDPVNTADLPAPIGSDWDIFKAVVTDEQGRFRIAAGSAFNPQDPLMIHVIKENRLPMSCIVRRPGALIRGDYEIPPVQLPASACLDLSFATEPGDVPPAFEGNPACLLYGYFPLALRAAPENAPPIPLLTNLPYKTTIKPRILVVPANVPVNLLLRREYPGGKNGYASFHMPDGPVTLKPGETRPLMMERVAMINWPFKILKPDGQPLDDLKIIINPLDSRHEWLFVDAYASYNQGVFTIPWYQGKPLEVGVVFDQFVEQSLRFKFPARETSSNQPTVVQLTPEQMEMFKKNKPGQKN